MPTYQNQEGDLTDWAEVEQEFPYLFSHLKGKQAMMRDYQVGVIPDEINEPGYPIYRGFRYQPQPVDRDAKQFLADADALSDRACSIVSMLLAAISGVLATVGVQWICGVFGR